MWMIFYKVILYGVNFVLPHSMSAKNKIKFLVFTAASPKALLLLIYLGTSFSTGSDSRLLRWKPAFGDWSLKPYSVQACSFNSGLSRARHYPEDVGAGHTHCGRALGRTDVSGMSWVFLLWQPWGRESKAIQLNPKQVHSPKLRVWESVLPTPGVQAWWVTEHLLPGCLLWLCLISVCTWCWER